jgi:hypothetical protein
VGCWWEDTGLVSERISCTIDWERIFTEMMETTNTPAEVTNLSISANKGFLNVTQEKLMRIAVTILLSLIFFKALEWMDVTCPKQTD